MPIVAANNAQPVAPPRRRTAPPAGPPRQPSRATIPGTRRARTDLIRGYEVGPWDSSEYVDAPLGRHQLGKTLYLDKLTIPVPHLANPALETPITVDRDGNEHTDVARACHLQLFRNTSIVITCAASAKSTHQWRDTWAAGMVKQCENTGVTADIREGTFGTEVVAVAARQQTVTIGVDGPRWTLLATLTAPEVTDDLCDLLDSVVADTVVNRGHKPMGPGDLFPLTPITPPARSYTTRLDLLNL